MQGKTALGPSWRALARRAALLLVTVTAHATAAELPELRPGEWVEVPGTRLRDVAPLPSPGGNVSKIVHAWSGGAFALQDTSDIDAHESSYWPTLTARDWRGTGNIERQRSRRAVSRFSLPLPLFLGTRLHPNWCEAYMGFPEGWTELDAAATPSSRKSSKRSRGKCGGEA